MVHALSSVTFTPYLVVTESLPSTETVKAWVRTKQPNLPPKITVEWVGEPGESPSIELVREMVAATAYAVTTQQCRVVLLSSLETASIPAQNALLKILEEPPAQTLIVLFAHQLSGVLPTIQSRCQVTAELFTKETSQSPEAPQIDAAAIYQQLKTAPLWQAIELADTYSDKAAALALIGHLLKHLEELQLHQPEPLVARHQMYLLTAYQRLHANIHTKLTLETAFFDILSQR